MALLVWIIDDDIVSQLATEYSVKQADYEIVSKSFDNASESLKALKEGFERSDGIPDIILLDLVMPEMDGLEFLRQVIKLVGFQSKIKIFIISSFSKSKNCELVKNHASVEGSFDMPLSRVRVDEIFQSLEVNDQ